MNSLAELILTLGLLWLAGAAILACSFVFVAALRGNPVAPLAVMISVPIQHSVVLEVGTVSVTVTQLLLWAFLAGGLLGFALGKIHLRMDLVTVLSGSLVLLYAISILQSLDLGAWAGETYRWTSAILFLWFARACFAERSPGNFQWVLVGLCVLSGGWAVAQVLLDSGPASFNRNGVIRAHGAFGEPNPFAAFCVGVTLPLVAFALLNRSVPRAVRLWVALGGAMGLMAALLTQSRGALLGIALGCSFIGAVWTIRTFPGARVAVWSGGALLAASAIVLFASQQPWERGESNITPANWANAEREAHWAAAYSMLTENPAAGFGAGGFNAGFRESTVNWRFRIPRGHAHNAYLQVASEAGVFALVVYIAFLGAVVASIWRRMRLDSCDWLRWGVLAVTLAMIIHQMFDYLQVLSLGILYAGLWAAVLGVNQARVHVLEHNGIN